MFAFNKMVLQHKRHTCRMFLIHVILRFSDVFFSLKMPFYSAPPGIYRFLFLLCSIYNLNTKFLVFIHSFLYICPMQEFLFDIFIIWTHKTVFGSQKTKFPKIEHFDSSVDTLWNFYLKKNKKLFTINCCLNFSWKPENRFIFVLLHLMETLYSSLYPFEMCVFPMLFRPYYPRVSVFRYFPSRWTWFLLHSDTD